MWEFFNPNPLGRRVGDCSIRALCAALDLDWDTVHDMTSRMSKQLGDMQSADAAWGAVLRQHGFVKQLLPDQCPDCYTAGEFARDNPKGTFVLAFGGHVSTIRDGTILDTWNTSNEIPIYVWMRKE